MSTESVNKFLSDVAYRESLRSHFDQVQNGQDFIQVCQELGYDFTIDELKMVVKENSEGVLVRRKTGAWTWLRQVPWNQ